MAFHQLTWRVGLPFVLLVLTETVALALLLRAQVAAEERTRLREVAEATVTVIGNKSLPTSRELAEYLSMLGCHHVFFRRYGALDPPPRDALEALPLSSVPADGEVRHQDLHDFVAIP